MPAGAWKQDLEKWRGSGGSLLVGELAWAEVGIVSRGQEKYVRGRRLWNFWVPWRRRPEGEGDTCAQARGALPWPSLAKAR